MREGERARARAGGGAKGLTGTDPSSATFASSSLGEALPASTSARHSAAERRSTLFTTPRTGHSFKDLVTLLEIAVDAAMLHCNYSPMRSMVPDYVLHDTGLSEDMCHAATGLGTRESATRLPNSSPTCRRRPLRGHPSHYNDDDTTPLHRLPPSTHVRC